MKKLSIFIIMLLFNGVLLYSQIAINNDGSAPDASAALDINYTNKGFLPPRMTKSQIAAISSPAGGLIVYCTTDGKYYAFIASAYAWQQVMFGSEFIIQPFPCGSSITKSHVIGSVAPVSKTVTYGTLLTNLTGSNKCWITHNLGASHQADSAADATEASAGWYWQFNRQQGYTHNGSIRTPNTTWITMIEEFTGWQQANDPCMLLIGPGWRIPTRVEWNNARTNGGWGNLDGAYAGAL